MIKPAVEGGKPIRKKFLIFGKPKITRQEIQEVVKTIKSGWLGTGPKTHIFEDKFKHYIGCKYAVALNSCTAGLHLALDVIGIKSGDEIITTPLTFPSTANVIVHHNAVPVFADVQLDTWNIDPAEIEKKITQKTRAIIPVDLHGRPCKLDVIKQIAKKHDLYVIEDAAHAAEAIFKGRHVGTWSDFTAFSFYVTKNIMTAEGGMLTTNNPRWAAEARIRRLHGISKDAWKRYSDDGYTPYETLYPGYKYNMIDLMASFGIHQLHHVEENLKVRTRYWNMYTQAFSHFPQLILPAPIDQDIRHACHLYAIILKTEQLKIKRNQFVDALNAEGIGIGIHFTALHLHKFYRETFSYKLGDFPHSEFVGSRTISLPLSPAMSHKDIHDVIHAVIKLVSYYKQ